MLQLREVLASKIGNQGLLIHSPIQGPNHVPQFLASKERKEEKADVEENSSAAWLRH